MFRWTEEWKGEKLCSRLEKGGGEKKRVIASPALNAFPTGHWTALVVV